MRAASAALVILAIVVQAIVLAQAGRFDPTRFFAFFTIQSNLIGVAAFAWLVANGDRPRSRALELLRGAAAVYLTVTFVVVILLLSDVDVQLQVELGRVHAAQAVPGHRRARLADRPAAAGAALPGRASSGSSIPLIWTALTMVRGAADGWYPYPFLDPANGGYATVAVMIVAITVGFLVLSGGDDRARPLARQRRSTRRRSHERRRHGLAESSTSATRSRPGMVTYPGLPVPEIHAVLDRATSAGRYAPGVTFQIDLITLCGNTGTYMDSPFHRWEDGADLAGLPLERLVDLPAVRIDVTGSGSPAIDADAFRPHELAGRAVLVHTGFDRFWRTDAYLHDNPFLTLEAVELLAAAGVALVGIDSLNIDSTDDPERPAHSILLRAGIPIVEHMTNLGAIPVEGARFTAIPAPIRGTGTFPVRAIAVLPGGA